MQRQQCWRELYGPRHCIRHLKSSSGSCTRKISVHRHNPSPTARWIHYSRHHPPKKWSRSSLIIIGHISVRQKAHHSQSGSLRSVEHTACCYRAESIWLELSRCTTCLRFTGRLSTILLSLNFAHRTIRRMLSEIDDVKQDMPHGERAHRHRHMATILGIYKVLLKNLEDSPSMTQQQQLVQDRRLDNHHMHHQHGSHIWFNTSAMGRNNLCYD